MLDNDMFSNSVKTVGLEKLILGLQVEVRDGIIEDVNILRNVLTQTWTVQMRGYIWSESREQQVQTIRYPSDWWQALKERWFPERALKRWPVIYKTFRYSIKVLYPDLRVAMPGQTATFAIFENGTMVK